MEWFESVKLWFEQYPWLFQFIIGAVIILISYIGYWVTNLNNS